MEPPLVRMPPAVAGRPKRSANQRRTACSTALAAGERCQRLQFWLRVAAT